MKMDFTGSYEAAIRERAYEIFLLRMKFGIDGDPVSDWMTAEYDSGKRDWRNATARVEQRRTALA